MTLAGKLMEIGDWVGPGGSHGALVALRGGHELRLPLSPEECRKLAGSLYEIVRVTITVEALEETP